MDKIAYSACQRGLPSLIPSLGSYSKHSRGVGYMGTFYPPILANHLRNAVTGFQQLGCFDFGRSDLCLHRICALYDNSPIGEMETVEAKLSDRFGSDSVCLFDIVRMEYHPNCLR